MQFTLPNFDFYHRLSARERKLAFIVVGALVVIVNLIAISTLLRSFREQRTQYADKSQDLRIQNLYAQEAPMWKQRTNWLKSKQPALANRDRAGTDLLSEIQAAARTNGVVLTTFQITPLPPVIGGERPTAKPEYQTVSVTIETQSDWGSLVRFLASVQRPEGFFVFDKATLHSDPNDATRMKGAFGISKWYASSSK